MLPEVYHSAHLVQSRMVQRPAVSHQYIKFRRVENPPGGVPKGYEAYRCHVPGFVVRGYLKSVTKAEDGSEVLEPDKEYTSTPDPSAKLESLVYIRNDAVIPPEFLDFPEQNHSR